jgi:hypothetical protein
VSVASAFTAPLALDAALAYAGRRYFAFRFPDGHLPWEE